MQMAEPGIFCEPNFTKVAKALKEKPDLTAHLYWSLHEQNKDLTVLAISSRLKQHHGMEWFLRGTAEIAANTLSIKKMPLIRRDLTQISGIILRGEMGSGFYQQLTEEQNNHISFLADITLIQAENLRRQAIAHLQ